MTDPFSCRKNKLDKNLLRLFTYEVSLFETLLRTNTYFRNLYDFHNNLFLRVYLFLIYEMKISNPIYLLMSSKH